MRDEYDFSQAESGPVVKSSKERITIRLDPEVIQWFRDQVAGGGNYQTLINEALQEHIQRRQGTDLEGLLRRVVREELKQAG
ncbi:BrnA antitoxin family protein [Thiorhodococcus minor]|uniref:BrnA antitoxin family protein n=1 Tax=Thiorhodococcus minor TaxID=57489 RepID=A0A6M0K0P0_9GAMM|nr:BrnA antitoxin family protein [Thiorhodococcus minor]NEV62864.1 BrnA antitoxin family protein [Thiorhodococcus minor]